MDRNLLSTTRKSQFNGFNLIGFNGAETNCRIAHILGILLMNSCNTDIFFSNYYHWQSVRFELTHRDRKHDFVTLSNVKRHFLRGPQR